MEYLTRKQTRTRGISFILLFVMLLFLAGCGFSDKSGNTSFSVTNGDNQGPMARIPGMLTDIHMIDEHTGWAVSWDVVGTGSYSILRTTDGGRHWTGTLRCTSTQSAGRGFMVPCFMDFHSATVATVLAPESVQGTPGGQARIFVTGDGGKTWRVSVVNASPLETAAVFVDGMHGWFLGTDDFPGNDSGSSYIGKNISLYRTSDGGATWKKIGSRPAVSQLPVTSDDAYGIVPFAASARMQFLDQTTGWLAGTSYRKDNTSFCWLYVTHDGGSTWHQISIAFPAGGLVAWTPKFFNAQDGVLPVYMNGPGSQGTPGTMLFVTHDGGQTWSGTTIAMDVTYAEYIDMEHAWNLADTSTKQFYATSDGWRHWTTGKMITSFKRITKVDFISPTVGWALADNQTAFVPAPGGGIRAGDVIGLLKTMDGGKTWSEISYSQA